MKIGLVLDDSLDKTDGVQQYVLTVGRWLSAQGHEVHYLVGETTRTDLPNIHSLSKNVRVSFNQNRLSVPLWGQTAVIKDLLEREHFDILHVQMPYSPFLAARIIKHLPKDTAVIGTFHILPFSKVESMAARMLGLLLSRSLKRFSEIICVSSPAQEFARSSFGVKSVIVPNAVDVAKVRVRKPSRPIGNAFRIIFLGRLVPRKGAPYLLRAVAGLDEQTRQQVQLYICGRGPDEKVLRREAARLGILERTTFTGFVPEKEKPALLAGADFAVFPATGGESFGIVLIEAIAAGAGVVIGGNNPGYSSVLEPTSEVLVDPRDEEAFTRLLHKLINNPGLRKRLHERQQAIVATYDIANVGPQIELQYKRAIAKNRAGRA